MKKAFLDVARISFSCIIACVFAVLAQKISCYHLAGISGFFFGGISSAYLFGLFETK